LIMASTSSWAGSNARVGLSMDVEVDVGKQEGEPLTAAARKEPAWSTRAFEPAHNEVDAMINKIIQANLASDEFTPQAAATPAAKDGLARGAK
ncbi:hypothetical protein FGX01_05715, partial [Xylella fastidiosa subsp. multiplex]|nr:hypothetical protein [Xylella fastidiosa subsp. multiplex]